VSGTLYAVGLGPGDPGLVTVRSAELLRAAEVVAYPVDASGDPGRAFQIARHYLPDGVTELALAMPMTGHRPTLEKAWEAGVAAITQQTEAGRDVVYLCLGDTLLYGSFGYLLARYEGPVEVIPGVISPVAAAAALGLPLVEGREPLVVVPDGADLDLLRGALALRGTVVVMKPSRLTADAVALLEEAGAVDRLWVSADVSLEAERVFRPGTAAELATLPYFSLVVIPPPRTDGFAPLAAGRSKKGSLSP
jgi:precorrin-2/cobalt-factor-2 C20-methyltransferase